MNEDEGTWLGHVLEHVALELQNVAGEDVTFGKTRSIDRPGLYSVVYEYAEREEGVAAGELALRLLCSLLPERLRPPAPCPRAGTGRPRATSTSASRSGARSGRPRPRSCTPPRSAASRGSGSTTSR